MSVHPSDDGQELARFVGTVLDLYEDDETYRPEVVRIVAEIVRLTVDAQRSGQSGDLQSFLRQSEDDLWRQWQTSLVA